MDTDDFHKLDLLLESALTSEPLLPSPLSLRDRIATKVRIAALIQEERRGFRSVAISAAALVAAAVSFTALFLSAVHGELWLARNMPGLLGYLDYVTTSGARAWPGVAGSSALMGLLFSSVAILVVVGLLFRPVRSH